MICTETTSKQKIHTMAKSKEARIEVRVPENVKTKAQKIAEK